MQHTIFMPTFKWTGLFLVTSLLTAPIFTAQAQTDSQTKAIQVDFKKIPVPTELSSNCNQQQCLPPDAKPTYSNCTFHSLRDKTSLFTCSLVWVTQNEPSPNFYQIYALPFDIQGNALNPVLLPLNKEGETSKFISAMTQDRWVIERTYVDGRHEFEVINPNAPQKSLQTLNVKTSILMVLDAKNAPWTDGVFILARPPLNADDKISVTDRFLIDFEAFDKANNELQTVWEKEINFVQTFLPKAYEADINLEIDLHHKYLAIRPEGTPVTYGQEILFDEVKGEQRGSFVLCLSLQNEGAVQSSFVLPNVYLRKNMLSVRPDNSVLFISPIINSYDINQPYQNKGWQLYSMEKNCQENSIKKLTLLQFPFKSNATGEIRVYGLLTTNEKNYILYSSGPILPNYCEECSEEVNWQNLVKSMPALYILETDQNGNMLKNHTVISPFDANHLFLGVLPGEHPDLLQYELVFTGNQKTILIMVHNKETLTTEYISEDELQYPQPASEALMIYRLHLKQ